MTGRIAILVLARELRIRRALRGVLVPFVLALLTVLASAAGAADEPTRQQMQGLDEQVQEIKADVLGIAAELAQLEERLLYPSNTQVAIFVSLAEGSDFRLDAVQILIDGTPVARHIYSYKELEALQKGGVQRIYTGNITTGSHELAVSIAGKQVGGQDFAARRSFTFSKDVEPRLVGLTVTGPGEGVELGDW